MRERVEELRQEALARWRNNQYEESLPLLDEALALATDEETRELLSINKSFAVIALGRTSPEVQALPRIILKRRNPRHVQLAAYYLQYKNRLEGDYKRAASYLQIAMRAADEAGDTQWKSELLIELGNLTLFDSRSADAITHYEAAQAILTDSPEHTYARATCLQNIGYCKLDLGDYQGGIDLIHQALDLLKLLGVEGFGAESFIDLCFGYLGLEKLEEARRYGEIGLRMAKDVRQIRNAHYLLGEVAFKSGDQARAEEHFGELAKFYPDFPGLKNLLLAIDLRAMVNLKL